MTKYHKWTDTENDYIRGTYNQPAAFVADALGLTVSQVRNRRNALRKQDEADRFVHVVEPTPSKVNASARPVNFKKYPLPSSEMDGKLKQFRLFEGMYPEPKDEPQPSLW